ATLSLAALEAFVHTDPDLEPIDLVAVAIDIDASVEIDAIEAADLPPNWRAFPAPPALGAIGERWMRSGRPAGVSVPTVLIPHERNFMCNAVHADFARLTLRRAEPFSFDPRMWKKRG